MTPRRRQSRIYWRIQGGSRRAWGDFRDYGDVGGQREPLVPPGERYATQDPDIALRLALRRLEELEGARKRRTITGRADVVTLAAYARDYLIAKKKAGQATDDWIDACQEFLERAVAFFGADRPLEGVRVSDVRAWSAVLQVTPSKWKRPFSPESVRRHLFTLSNLYRFAQEAELVPPGFNPVAAFTGKPPRPQREAKWLEVHDAALLLEAARTLPPVRTAAGEALGAGFVHALLATYLLTGGRRAEVLGLELDDVSCDRQTVTFRPNAWRRLKTRDSWRVVPLWPQLKEILDPYLVERTVRRGGTLLFPSPEGGAEAMLQEIRRLIDRAALRCGWKRRELNSRMFRHTYCAARLQTLDQGAPVSVYTVARELGHESEEMVRRVYAHLGTTRHRAEVVEFRVSQHLEALKDRLGAMGFVTGSDTLETESTENEKPQREVSRDEAFGSEPWARRDSNARPLAPEASALSS
jgi:integrase